MICVTDPVSSFASKWSYSIPESEFSKTTLSNSLGLKVRTAFTRIRVTAFNVALLTLNFLKFVSLKFALNRLVGERFKKDG